MADALGAVPGAVEGEEGAALVFGGELLTGVEEEVEHGDVGAQLDVSGDGFGDEFGVLALVARVFVRAGVGERPAVEGALLDVGEVVGDQVVAEFVALLDGRP